MAISFLGGQIIAGKIWASLGIKAGSAAAYGVAAAAGALSGYIMTGSLEGTLWGAFSAVTFYGIGQKFGSSLGDGKGVMGSGYSKAELARATVAHGVAGGTLSKLQGGRFGHGLASAGITKVASPAIEFAANDNSFAEVTMATIAGGSISSISGGKFANGAVTVAMAYALASMGRTASGGQEGGWMFPEGRSTDIQDYDTVMTNGILGDRGQLELLVNETGIPGYFNPSRGFFRDVIQSFRQKFFGWAGDPLAAGLSRGLLVLSIR